MSAVSAAAIHSKQAKQIPAKFVDSDGVTRLIVPDRIWDRLHAPTLDHMPVTGFMDISGEIHYELNRAVWHAPPFWSRARQALSMQSYYMAIPRTICAGCTQKPLDQLMGGGIAHLNRPERLLHLEFLGLRARSEIPQVDHALRHEAIFNFQKSYNQLARWLGADRVTTYTAIIPDAKMQALGWKPFKIGSWSTHWTLLKGCAPSSFFAKMRAYEINV